MSMQTLVPSILGEHALQPLLLNGRNIGCEITLHMTRYRNCPLSCIEQFALELDGMPVRETDITFCLHGKRFMINQLPDLWAEYWGLQEDARLVLLMPGGLKPGVHTVDLRMHIRVPYALFSQAYRPGLPAEGLIFSSEDVSARREYTVAPAERSE